MFARITSVAVMSMLILSVTACSFDFANEETPAVSMGSVTPTSSSTGSAGPVVTWQKPEKLDGRDYAYRLPGMDCLVSEYGIRRKIIPVKGGVRCLSGVRSGVPQGPRLRFFNPYFVFAVHPAKGPITFFQIGSTPQRESIIGWVAASNVACWDMRVAGRYVRRAGRRTPPLLIYMNVDALEELIRNGTTRQEPMARATFSGSQAWMPWPIAESRYFTHDGRTYEFLRLNFLGEHHEGAMIDPSSKPVSRSAGSRSGKVYSNQQVSKIRNRVEMLDVVFIMDVTGSMQPYLDAVVRTVKKLAGEFRSLGMAQKVAFSLVVYRDHDVASGFVTDRFDLTTDYDKFIEKIGLIRAGAGGDPTEAVYDGMLDAIDNTAWRGQGLSARVAVLVGDCPAHERDDPQNPNRIDGKTLVDKARAKGIKICSLAVGSRGGHPMYVLRWKQFEYLATKTGGVCHSLEDAKELVGHVKQILNTEAAVVHQRSVVLEALAKGKTKTQIAAEKHMNVREVTEVMEFLRGGGVDIDRLSPGVPTFATGWCLAELDGVPLIEKEVYVARAELDMLLSELSALCMVLSPDLPGTIYRTALGSRVNPFSFFAKRRSEPMDVFLMSKGIPCGQGILKLTRDDIEHMSEERRAEERERIARKIVPQILNARNNDRYFTWLNDLEFGWIKESLLP